MDKMDSGTFEGLDVSAVVARANILHIEDMASMIIYEIIFDRHGYGMATLKVQNL